MAVPGAVPAARIAAARTSLPGNPLAASAARRFARTALADWTSLDFPAVGRIPDQVADEVVLLMSELVTNAVVHAGTAVEVSCALDVLTGNGEVASVVVEVTDHHPTRFLRGEPPEGGEDPGRGGHGLRLVAELAECWGTAYRRDSKTVWFQLPVTAAEAVALPGEPLPGGSLTTGLPADSGGSLKDGSLNEESLKDDPSSGGCGGSGTSLDGDSPSRDAYAVELLAPAPRRVGVRHTDADRVREGALSFLAEASELLAGQFDEDMVTSLAAQLLVPRFADWSAVWLDTEGGPPRLAQVWHASESRIETLRQVLEKEPPELPVTARGRAVPWPWPSDPSAYGPGGAALACRLIAGGRTVGTLLLGRAGLMRVPGEVAGLVEDFARRVALALASARQYTRQATISRVLQRGLLPSRIARIPGVESAVVYEPTGGTSAGGDFYDIFPAGNGRWVFVLGDVCGNGPEAAVVTGLVRPWLRLLAREGYGVGAVLERLNRMLGEEAVEAAVEGAAEAVAAGVGLPVGGGVSRFLSLLYGELVPLGEDGEGGIRCTLASAGHPLPLVLRPDGSVRTVAEPQILLGVVDGVAYESETFELAPGETLVCVTDGVTEHRSGSRQFDDGDGLASLLGDCVGLDAGDVAERIRQAVHAFAVEPPDDDLAMLVLRAR
ncbi:ATP-binding SpoIIE family protein phosphatase [Streptomyces sp. ME19-01-6]|uniref:ATP-binding SpoIIE family protein phosphatase n=1 Tax=Streptomyces sp. ME19-01-6 TaxID=3028686 RepID=UPI0029BC18E7|nr:ATP-binding SpoIIE family protein phosphatase [Streptomyces sp. ME19-01-6]MDX3224272.1 SpoIIE family protein phosphatase [Streptomyces sp. ME19-01-6]